MENDMSEIKEKGMRFWLKGIALNQAPEHTRVDEPFPKKGVPASFYAPRIKYRGLPLRFNGEIYIDDPDVARKMMADGGGLMFDPQEAIDKLGCSVGEIRGMGFTVTDKGAEPTAGPAKEPAAPIPSLYTKTKSELAAFADDNGIFVSKKLSLDKMREEVEAQLKQKEKKQ